MTPGSVLLVAVAVVAAACDVGVGPDAGNPVTDPAGGGSLEVVQEVECCYIEGAVSYILLQTDGGEVVAETEAGSNLEVAGLAAGTYVLESWQRPCELSCSRQPLDPARDRCTREFDLGEGQELQAFIEVTPFEGCTITVGHEVAPTSGDGALHAFEADTGQQRWRVAVGGDMVALAALGAGRAYVTTLGQGDMLQAIDLASGEVVWHHKTAAWWPPGGAMVDGDTLYATLWDGTTRALDAATGRELWRAATAGESPTAPALTAGVLVVGTGTQGNLYGLDPATGQEQWRQQLVGGIPAAPTVDGGDVYVTALDRSDGGTLVAVDAASGRTVWEATLRGPVLGGAAVGAGVVYAGSGSIAGDTGALQAFDATIGAPRWTVITDGVVYNTPILTDSLVLAADLTNSGGTNLYAFRVADGELEWTVPLPGEMRDTPLVQQDQVYLATHPAHLVLLDIEDGTQVRRLDSPDLEGDVDELTAPRGDGTVVVVGSS